MSGQKVRKNFEELGFSDDFMFGKIMEDPELCRFYQGAIDTDYLDKGNSYKTLPDSKIIFICTFDPFARGIPQYTFSERCEEASELKLNDGTTKIFYNCCYEGDELSQDIKELFEYIRSGHANSPLTKRIDEAVIKGRKNEMWRSEYLKERQILMDEREEGREEERANTERERKRAEAAERRVAELEKLLAAK